MNGNGKTPQVSISTLVQTKWSHGDFYGVISSLIERRSSGKLVLSLSQGGIVGVEFTEKSSCPEASCGDTLGATT